MANLVTLNEAKLQLRVTWEDEDLYIQLLLDAAEAAVLDYIKKPYMWKGTNVPPHVKLAILIVLSEYYDSYRDGGEIDNKVAMGYLSPAVTSLLHRLRSPAYAQGNEMAKQKRTATRNDVAGALRSYIHFQQRSISDDGFGNLVPGGDFETKFSVYANFRPLSRGSASGVEDVFAAQLQGNQPYVVTVRKTKAMEQITSAWRIVDARNPNRHFALKSPPFDVTNEDRWLELIVALDGAS